MPQIHELTDSISIYQFTIRESQIPLTSEDWSGSLTFTSIELAKAIKKMANTLQNSSLNYKAYLGTIFAVARRTSSAVIRLPVIVEIESATNEELLQGIIKLNLRIKKPASTTTEVTGYLYSITLSGLGPYTIPDTAEFFQTNQGTQLHNVVYNNPNDSKHAQNELSELIFPDGIGLKYTEHNFNNPWEAYSKFENYGYNAANKAFMSRGGSSAFDSLLWDNIIYADATNSLCGTYRLCGWYNTDNIFDKVPDNFALTLWKLDESNNSWTAEAWKPVGDIPTDIFGLMPVNYNVFNYTFPRRLSIIFQGAGGGGYLWNTTSSRGGQAGSLFVGIIDIWKLLQTSKYGASFPTSPNTDYYYEFKIGSGGWRHPQGYEGIEYEGEDSYIYYHQPRNPITGEHAARITCAIIPGGQENNVGQAPTVDTTHNLIWPVYYKKESEADYSTSNTAILKGAGGGYVPDGHVLYPDDITYGKSVEETTFTTNFDPNYREANSITIESESGSHHGGTPVKRNYGSRTVTFCGGGASYFWNGGDALQSAVLGAGGGACLAEDGNSGHGGNGVLRIYF